MRFLPGLILWLVVAAGLHAQDSLRRVEIAPGIVHSTYILGDPNVINVLTVELSHTEYRIESYRPTGLTRTSRQVEELEARGVTVIGAVNADFFTYDAGWPINNQVANGLIVRGTASVRSHIGFDDRGMPFIERVSFSGWVLTPAGRRFVIDGVNETHRNNSIVLHTTYSDSVTPFTGPGKALLLRLVGMRWSTGDTLLTVVSGPAPESLRPLSLDEAVLWIGGGPSVVAVRTELRENDTLRIFLGFLPLGGRVENLVGGLGRVLLNGKPVSDSINVEERASIPFLRNRHPRTVVGFDRDTSKVFLCTVDGRQTESRGMNFGEMAEFLLSIGVWNAMNLDGGGSTTMVIDGSIVNSPSDAAGERPVANTLVVTRQRQ